MGKREHAQFFLEETVEHGLEGCNYLLGARHGGDPQPGYAMASWERATATSTCGRTSATLRRMPWLEATALVLCDVAWPGRLTGRRVAAPGAAPPGRAGARRGFEPMFGSELEFYLLKESYAEAHARHYRDLTPSVPYILDYHVLATTYDEALSARSGTAWQGAGIPVESSKGEAWPGQHEINFRYADALTMADNHVIYKNGAKEIAHRTAARSPSWRSPTTPGSAARATSTRASGATARTRSPARARSSAASSPAGSPARASSRSSSRRTSTRTSATRPAAGRRRRSPGAATTAPAASASSATAPAQRVETRIPGGDVNPYLAFAALIAAGPARDRAGARAAAAARGQRVRVGRRALPSTLREAIAALEAGTIARARSATRSSTTT